MSGREQLIANHDELTIRYATEGIAAIKDLNCLLINNADVIYAMVGDIDELVGIISDRFAFIIDEVRLAQHDVASYRVVRAHRRDQ